MSTLPSDGFPVHASPNVHDESNGSQSRDFAFEQWLDEVEAKQSRETELDQQWAEEMERRDAATTNAMQSVADAVTLGLRLSRASAFAPDPAA